MATASQINTILTNLYATYETLSADIAAENTHNGRTIRMRQLTEVQGQIDHWEAKLTRINAGKSRPAVIKFRRPG